MIVLVAAIVTMNPAPTTGSTSSDSHRLRESENATSPQPNTAVGDRDHPPEADHGAPRREIEGAGERAHAGRRHQEAERVRPAVQ